MTAILSTEPTLTLPTFTLYSQTGRFILSAHVLEERVAQKVEDWERAGEIVRVAADLTPEPYAGPGIGITDTCGVCHRTFDLMYPPEQYPTLVNDVDEPEALICDACADAMDADDSAPSCHICGKTPGDPHSPATRMAHSDHMARLGWSGMCTAPRDETPKTEA